MNILPIRFGEIELKTTRAKFVDSLVDLTEDNYPLMPIIIADTHKLKDYGREVYDNRIMLFKIAKDGRHFSLIFTTIHCRLIEKENVTILKYHIRLNLFANFFILSIWIGTVYLLYHSIFVERGFSLKTWFIIAIAHIMQFWNFRRRAKADFDFLMKLVNH